MTVGGFLLVDPALVARRLDGALVPQLGDEDDHDALAVHEAAGGIYHYTRDVGGRVRQLALRRVDILGSHLVVEVIADALSTARRLMDRLDATRKATYVQAASLSLPRRIWLRDHDYRVVRSHAEGAAPQPLLDPIAAVHPSIVFGGDSPIVVAMAGQSDPARVYY